MVLIFSSYANQSRQVRREVQQAFDGEKPVVPFRIENVSPEKTLRYYMGPVHWLDALTPPLELHLEKLVSSVKPLIQLGGVKGAEREQPSTPRMAPKPKELRDNRVALLLTGAVCVALGAAGVWTAIKLLTAEPQGSTQASTSKTTPKSIQPTPAPDLAPNPARQPTAPAQALTVLTAASEAALKPKDTFRECTKCPVMTVVPAGAFTMGAPANEPGSYIDERPQHRVTMARPFAVGQFALTFDEWDACAADGGCSSRTPNDWGWGRGSRPVIDVSWVDAKGYVSWLAQKTGRPYRLLTETEYEYATRAGTTSAYPWGSAVGVNNANCIGCGSQWDNRQTAPVGSFSPNKFGLFDMVGNVWQWTEDCYHENYNGAPADGSAWTTGDCKYHVVRGGSWNGTPDCIRSANRYRCTVVYVGNTLGFRVARSLATP